MHTQQKENLTKNAIAMMSISLWATMERLKVGEDREGMMQLKKLHRGLCALDKALHEDWEEAWSDVLEWAKEFHMSEQYV